MWISRKKYEESNRRFNELQCRLRKAEADWFDLKCNIDKIKAENTDLRLENKELSSLLDRAASRFSKIEHGQSLPFFGYVGEEFRLIVQRLDDDFVLCVEKGKEYEFMNSDSKGDFMLQVRKYVELTEVDCEETETKEQKTTI